MMVDTLLATSVKASVQNPHPYWQWRNALARCRTAFSAAHFKCAVHAAQLGAHAAYASAVGDDALGRDAKRRLEGLNVDCELVQTRPGLETGFVSCVLDDNGDATYDIAYPAAWDSVHAEPSLLTAARSFDCLVHGSLALRGEETASTLKKLAADAVRRVFDINVRPLPDGIEVRDLVEPLLQGCT